jgi:hypothetical protein
MRPFNTDLLDHLNVECNGDPIHFLGLGVHCFQLAFSSIAGIQTMTKAVFSLRGKIYSWEAGPSDIPVWLLVGQTPTHFELPTVLALRLNLASGDYVEFHTDERPYEAVIIDFGKRMNAAVMEIF